MPVRDRLWFDRIREYERANEGEWGDEHAKGIRSALRRYQFGIDRSGGWSHTPGIWERVGLRRVPLTPTEVEAIHVSAVRDSPIWAPKTRDFYLQALRGFLRHFGNPISEDDRLWALDTAPLNRRWLSKEQLTAIWAACRDDYDRLAVASTGFNGLRRVEVLRLRARDALLAADDPQARIWGKGRNGGRYRTIPVSRHLYAVLVSLKRTGLEPFFPWRKTTFDVRLSAVGRLAGLPFNPSAHTLRRTFGRIAYNAGVPLVSIQNIYGHASPVMSAHYIGIDQAEMVAGLARFEAAMEV